MLLLAKFCCLWRVKRTFGFWQARGRNEEAKDVDSAPGIVSDFSEMETFHVCSLSTLLMVRCG